MPQGDKSSYTRKQKRQAEHIEESAKKSGRSRKSAERIAWATVNKMTGGGKKSGSGRGKRINKAPARRGGRKATKSRRTTAASRGGRSSRTRSGQRTRKTTRSASRPTRRARSPARSRSRSRPRTVKARA